MADLDDVCKALRDRIAPVSPHVYADEDDAERWHADEMLVVMPDDPFCDPNEGLGGPDSAMWMLIINVFTGNTSQRTGRKRLAQLIAPGGQLRQLLDARHMGDDLERMATMVEVAPTRGYGAFHRNRAVFRCAQIPVHIYTL